MKKQIKENPLKRCNRIAQEFGYLGREIVRMMFKDEELVEAVRFYNDLREANDDEILGPYVQEFSKGEIESINEITIDDVKEFVVYIKEQIAAQEEEEDLVQEEPEEDLVTVMLDNVKNTSKPQGAAIGAVQKRLAAGATEITIKDLAEALATGATFKPAYLSGTTNDTWESQSLFALDFDNGTPFNSIMEKCNMLKMKPCFAYTSFSNMVDKDGTGPKERFRLVFRVEDKITDARLRNALQIALMTLFEECDEACKDATRLFFGGNDLLHLDEAVCIDPAEVIGEKLPSYLKATDENNNFAREIKKYCESVGLNIYNGLPSVKIEVTCEDDFLNAKSDVNAGNSIIYYRTSRQNVKKCTFNFNIKDTSNFKSGRGGSTVIKKAQIENDKETFKLIEKFDFEALAENCQFYNDFISGESWPLYHQLKGIATNLCNIKGGQKRALEALELFQDQYPNQYSYINAQNCIVNIGKTGYAPMRCSNFDCPYYEECDNDSVNMIGAATRTTKTSVIELKDEVEYKDIDLAFCNAVEEMRDYLEAPATDKHSMFMLIGPTGVGKTTMLKDLQTLHNVDFSNTVICLPTHNTVKDVFPRVSEDNYVVASELELEDDSLMALYNRYRKIGNYKMAYHVLEGLSIYASDLDSVKERKTRDAIRIEEFLKLQKEIRTTSKTIFCTHKKALNLNNRNVDTIIIDEDILLNGLFEQVAIDVAEITQALNIANEHDFKVIAAALNELLNVTDEARRLPMHIIPLKAKCISDKEIKSFRDVATNIDFDIIKYLKVEQVISDVKGQVCGSFRNELPYKKVIVMSATAAPEVYKAFLPNTEIIVHDMGNIKTEGRIVHHHIGTSRQAMRTKSTKLFNKIKEEAPGVTNVISFKEQQKALEKEGFNFICNFGNCTGIDAYKGQDLIVVGTPHVNNMAYMLLAATIKPGIQVVQDFEMTEVKRNGFKFSFNTFKNIESETGKLLYDLQMYYIETELIQAIGRARALREDCTVHVFSNLPQRGSVLYR